MMIPVKRSMTERQVSRPTAEQLAKLHAWLKTQVVESFEGVPQSDMPRSDVAGRLSEAYTRSGVHLPDSLCDQLFKT